MLDLVVTAKRGLNVRKSPVIANDNLVGTLAYGRHFYAETLRRIPPLTWVQDKTGAWIVIANGKNPYVTQMNGQPLPLG